MYFSKYVELGDIKIQKRILTPIAHILGFYINDTYLSFKYTVVAFKICEDDLIYYKNILLSEEEFIKLKNNSLLWNYFSLYFLILFLKRVNSVFKEVNSKLYVFYSNSINKKIRNRSLEFFISNCYVFSFKSFSSIFFCII